METIEEEAELFAKRRFELDPIYANGLYYGFIECGKSKWFQAEKIKAQIEVLEKAWILKPPVDELIYELEQQLKQLE